MGAWFEDSDLQALAATHGTPFYAYHRPTLVARTEAVSAALGDAYALYYAVKANSNLALLRELCGRVAGLDVSSWGEIEQGRLAGFDPPAMSFAGPAKTDDELVRAVEARIGSISVESSGEITRLAAICARLGRTANVVLRINPAREVKGFAMKMGGRATQFGVPEADMERAAAAIRANAAVLRFDGVHVYAGTQCFEPASICAGVEDTMRLAHALWPGDSAPAVINCGGGFGVSYFDAQELDLGATAAGLRALAERHDPDRRTRRIIELGRYLVSSCGIYVARVVDVKRSQDTIYATLDGGMNHHQAAAGNLGAGLRRNYLVYNTSNPRGAPIICSLAGPLCTPIDLMGSKLSLPEPRVGDLLAFANSGSYGFTASPLFWLGRGSPVELMGDDAAGWAVVRAARDLQAMN